MAPALSHVPSTDRGTAAVAPATSQASSPPPPPPPAPRSVADTLLSPGPRTTGRCLPWTSLLSFPRRVTSPFPGVPALSPHTPVVL